MIVVILVNTGTNDAIAQLVDKIFDSFEKEQFILGVFIDMSKAFDTVDHSILLKKLKFYGITDKNLARFESYLSNKKQYTHVCKSNNTGLKFATCSLFKDLFLNRLLVVYVNVLPKASRLLDPIMFADDTNLSFNHKDTKHL